MPISISQIVGVVLALAVVYYILGLVVSGVTKWLLEVMETRGKIFEDFLKKNLLEAAEDAKKGTLEKIKKMPQVNALRPVRYKYGGLGIFVGKTELSNYVERISPRSLVDALFDLEGTAATQKEKVKKVIEMLPKEFTGLDGNPIPFETRANLLKMADDGFYTFDQWREKLETWFGNVMDQSAQQFKAAARKYVVLFSLVAAFVLGVDTLDIAQRVWQDASYAKQFDTQATLILNSGPEVNKQEELDKLYGRLDALQVINIPFWVQPGPDNVADLYVNQATPSSAPYGNWLFMRILGLLITGLAVSQGSSFWYDIIRQIKGEQKTAGAASKETETNPTAPTAPMTPGDPNTLDLFGRSLLNAIDKASKTRSSDTDR
jgi:hypothetical protein